VSVKYQHCSLHLPLFSRERNIDRPMHAHDIFQHVEKTPCCIGKAYCAELCFWRRSSGRPDQSSLMTNYRRILMDYVTEKLSSCTDNPKNLTNSENSWYHLLCYNYKFISNGYPQLRPCLTQIWHCRHGTTSTRHRPPSITQSGSH